MTLSINTLLISSVQVDLSGVSRGVFVNNRALFAGGAVFADTASTSKLAVEYNHTLSQGLFGTCFLMFGNEPLGTFPVQVLTEPALLIIN